MPVLAFLCRARRPSRKALLRVALCLLGGYVAVVAVLLAFEDRLVFHPYPPSRRWLDPPAERVFQDVWLATAGGPWVHARWYPCPEAAYAVLVCHSRSGNLSLAVPPDEVRRWHE